jgi:hypothetical protein
MQGEEIGGVAETLRDSTLPSSFSWDEVEAKLRHSMMEIVCRGIKDRHQDLEIALYI